MKRINQKLEQYLKFFVDHRQKNWPEWLASAEFVIDNRVHLTIQVSPFIANYSRELRIEVNLRRKEKIEKATKFAEKIRKVQEEAKVVLIRVQEEIKGQENRGRKKAEV